MKLRSQTSVIILLALIVIIAIGATSMVVLNHEPDIENGAADDFYGTAEEPAVYTDLNGTPIELKSYAGKVMVVNVWASWSPFSQTDLRSLTALASEYKSEEVVFLAVNRKELKEQAGRYLATIGELPGVEVVIDTSDQFYRSTGGYAMPETVIYDQEGELAAHFRTAIDTTDIRNVINDLLK